MVVAVALHGEHLAVADAHVEPAAGAAVAADVFTHCSPEAASASRGQAEPGEGRGGGGGLEEVAAREGHGRSPGLGRFACGFALARRGRVRVARGSRSSAPTPSRRGPSRGRSPPPGPGGSRRSAFGGRRREVLPGRAVAHEALHEQQAVRPPSHSRTRRGSRAVAGLAGRPPGSGRRPGGRGPASRARPRRRGADERKAGRGRSTSRPPGMDRNEALRRPPRRGSRRGGTARAGDAGSSSLAYLVHRGGRAGGAPRRGRRRGMVDDGDRRLERRIAQRELALRARRRSTRTARGRPPAARGSRSSSPPRRSRSRNCARRCRSRAVVELGVGLPGGLRAPSRSPMSATSASIAWLRSSNVRSWIVSTRAFSSSSGHLWQRLAGAVDVEQRAAHVVVADLRARRRACTACGSRRRPRRSARGCPGSTSRTRGAAP